MKALRGGVLAASLLWLCGCDAASVAYFLLPEAKVQPEIKKLASDDPKAEVKVVVLPFVNVAVGQTEAAGADDALARQFARQLTALCEDNQEKVKVVSQAKVRDYLSTHPARAGERDFREVGRYFRADYVVILDLHSLSLYEKGSQDVYRGRADLTVSLVDVKDPDESAEQRDLNLTYPDDAGVGALDPTDAPVSVFRDKFFGYIGKRLAWHFSAHRKRDGYYAE